MATNYTRRINLYINGKEVVTEIRSVTAEMQKLVNKQKNMTIGSKEYVSAGERIRLLKGIITNHNHQLKETATGWERIVQVSNRLQGILQELIVGAAVLVGVVAAGKKAVSMFAEFDDKVANVARTTGLTKQEIYAISEALKKVDTRTAQLDLMNLGVIAGKLGIAKEDVLGFIKAADKLNVAFAGALGPDTEEVVNQIGKLVSVFKIEEKFGIETSMLKIGSALTTLGNASTANEGYIVEFSKRVGGIAPIVNVSIQDIMGLAATLDQLGQTSEVSSTVYSAMVTGMFKKTAEYANIAGMSVDGFRKILKQDTNFAFIKVLEGLNGNNAGMERMVALMGDMGIEGKRGIQVLGVLSNNTKMLREQQTLSNDSFYKGNAIYTSFNLLNDSAQAKLEKARKRVVDLAVELGQKLLPVLTLSTSGFSYFVKTISTSIDFFFRHSKAITNVVVTLAAYIVVVKGLAVWETFRQKVFTRGLILSNLEAIATRLRIMLTNTATIAQLRALAATKALNATMAASLWGALAAGIAFATMKIVEWVQNANKASVQQEAINNAINQSVEKMVEQSAKINMLVSLVNSENVSLAGKKKAIEDLKAIIPGYTAMLDAQGKVIYQNAGAVKEYINQLRRQYVLESYKEEYAKASVDFARAQQKKDDAIVDYNTTMTTPYKEGTKRTNDGSLKSQKINAILDAGEEMTAAQTVVDALQNRIESTITAMDDLPGKINKISSEMIIQAKALEIPGITPAQVEILKKQLSDLYKKKQALINLQKGITTPETVNLENPFPSNNATGVSSSDKKEADKAAKTAEEAYKQQQEIKKKAIQSSISIMEEGYKKELFTLHAAYVAQREEILHELATNKSLTIEEKRNLNISLKNNDKKYVQDYFDLKQKTKLTELKFQKELISLKLESTAKDSEQESYLLLQQINANRELELEGITETGEQKAALQKAINAKYNKLEQDENNRYINQYLDEVLAHDTQVLSETKIQQLQELKEKRAAGQISKKEYNRQLLDIDRQYVQESLQIAIDHAQAELDILVAAGENTTQAQEALNELKLKKQDAGTNKETDKPEWTAKDTLNTSVEAAQMIADATFQISRDKNQRELDDKLNQLAMLRDAELLNKHLTENQKNAINAKYAAKEKALKQNAWKQQHKADLAQAWVNLALSVGKAAINIWPLPAIPMMAMAALQSGLQIAAISAQKMPAFSEGGFTSKNSDNLTPAGIVHANEYVIPAEGVNNPQLQPFLQMIEVARLKKSLPTLNPAILGTGNNFFAAGGFTTKSGTSGSTPAGILPGSSLTIPDMSAAMLRFANAIDKLQENGIHGKWSLFDLEKIQKDKSNIQSATNM